MRTKEGTIKFAFRSDGVAPGGAQLQESGSPVVLHARV